MILSDIEKEIDNWIVNYLDIPSEFYNGNKPCPFALQAWRAENIKLIIGEAEACADEMENWNDEFVLVICVFDPEYWDAEKWANKNNEYFASKDLYAMPFTPSQEPLDDPELDKEEWGTVVDYNYGLLFMQRLKELNRYSRLLEEKGYYKNVSEEFLDYVTKRRSAEWHAEEAKQCEKQE